MFFCNYRDCNEQTIFTPQFCKSTLDQRNNEQSTNQQPNKSEDQRNKDITKHEANLCGIC